jgi:hypothetical protein
MNPQHLPSLILPRFLLDGHHAELEAAAGGKVELVAGDDASLLDAMPATLEVIVTGIDEATFGARSRRRASAGCTASPQVSSTCRPLRWPSAASCSPAAGAYATAMAVRARRDDHARPSLPSWLDGQREHRWLEAGTFDAKVLRGKRLGIVGYGAVGRELATAAQALGMEVWATKRTPLFLSGEPLDRLLASTDLRDLLSACDVIVLCASLNRGTQHLIGADELAAMKPTAC